MLFLLTALAGAGPAPQLSAGAFGVVGNSASGVRPAGGLTGSAGGLLGPRLVGELAMDLGATDRPGFYGQIGPRLRIHPGDPNEPGVSALLGGGVIFDTNVLITAMQVGVGYDTGPIHRWRPRIESRLFIDPLLGEHHLALSVSMRRVDLPKPPPPPPPEPEPTQLDLPDDSMVWLPTPVCEWLPPGDANAVLAERKMQLDPVQVISPAIMRGLPAAAEEGEAPEPPPTEPAAPVPTTGQIVVAAWPGDVIEVDGVPNENPSGLAVVRHEEGIAQLAVRGGGRSFETPIGVAAGHAAWVSLPPPEGLRVTFVTGTSRLTTASKSDLEELLAKAGNSYFEVWGTTSPEGTEEANAALRASRADVAVQALLSAGVAEERIEVRDRPSEPDLPVEAQRAAIIRPFFPGDSP